MHKKNARLCCSVYVRQGRNWTLLTTCARTWTSAASWVQRLASTASASTQSAATSASVRPAPSSTTPAASASVTLSHYLQQTNKTWRYKTMNLVITYQCVNNTFRPGSSLLSLVPHKQKAGLFNTRGQYQHLHLMVCTICL